MDVTSYRRLEDDSIAYIRATHGDVETFVREHMVADVNQAVYRAGVLEISEKRCMELGFGSARSMWTHGPLWDLAKRQTRLEKELRETRDLVGRASVLLRER